MTKIVKLEKINVSRAPLREIDKWLNVPLGKNGRIMTNNILKKDPGLNQFFNNETMGALDNYAEHEKLRIYIKPLLHDVFNDVAVSVYKGEKPKAKFPINIARQKEDIPRFFRELYTKVHNAAHSTVESENVQKAKHTDWNDFKAYVDIVIDRYNDARFELAQRLSKKID